MSKRSQYPGWIDDYITAILAVGEAEQAEVEKSETPEKAEVVQPETAEPKIEVQETELVKEEAPAPVDNAEVAPEALAASPEQKPNKQNFKKHSFKPKQ